jgi:hypothetical protein
MSALAAVAYSPYVAAAIAIALIAGLIGKRTRLLASIVIVFAVVLGAFGAWVGAPYESVRAASYFFTYGAVAAFVLTVAKWALWNSVGRLARGNKDAV